MVLQMWRDAAALKLTKLCFNKGKTSEFSRHLHFQNTTYYRIHLGLAETVITETVLAPPGDIGI